MTATLPEVRTVPIPLDGHGLTCAHVHAIVRDRLPVVVTDDGMARARAAHRTATELARVTADDRVLVLGASGGVGSILVSLCRSLGARVYGAVGSPEKRRKSLARSYSILAAT